MKPASIIAVVVLFALSTVPLYAQDAVGRRALEHEDYDLWNSIDERAISEDGKWIAFSLKPAEGASTLTIREVASQKQYTILNGSGVRFGYDGRFAAYLIKPDPDLIKKLEEDEDRKGDLPKPKLGIVDFTNDRHITLPDVQSFKFQEKASGWITYSPSKSDDKSIGTTGKSKITEKYTIESSGLKKAALAKKEEGKEEKGEKEKGKEEKAKEKEKEKGDEKKKKEKEKEKDNGEVLVLRNLESGIERRFPDVTSHRFSKYGALLAFASSASDVEDDGVFVFNLSTEELTQVIAGRGSYHSLAFSEDEKQLVFLSDRDDYGPVKPSLSLYLWTSGKEEVEEIAAESSEAIPEGWWLASTEPEFTEDGRRVLFNTQPKPDDAGKSKAEIEKEEKAAKRNPVAKFDLWHWKDTALQPEQVLEAKRERNRSYRALYDLKAKKIVQLATKAIPEVRLDARATGDMAIGTDYLKYGISQSWESPGFNDSYLVNLKTGEAKLVLEKVRATASLSPDGKFYTWWDPEQEHYFARSISNRATINLTGDIPVSFADELNDRPMPSRSYGSAGWLDDDKALLLYDRFDIWQVYPTGRKKAKCLTGEQGRSNRTRYRYVRLDDEERSINPDEPLMLSVFNEETKASGYSTLDSATGTITSMLMLDESVGGLRKAQQADTVLLTRQTFRRFPDIWATTTDFEQLSRISFANPQQRDYLWGSSELVHYETTEGQPLDGILYKPDNFESTGKYPMMVYFYERRSDRLHYYYSPSAGRASVNISFYVSRGYVVFVPDIPYETGYPGQSAANAVLPGIQSIVDLGFIDSDRIGVQGHSWGGYQIAYLVTMTDVFACAEAGAPVTNMTSAYGGIRWASGRSRMFQYEKTQSRIGGTLWDARDLYLENSPVFFADKIETPLLILHNDEDGAVPWYQGIELFVAMRRLEKPVWLLNYNGEGHGLGKKENKLDFTKRMQQFFDHHLQDAPATQWIVEGIPAVDKGKEFGFEPVQGKAASEELESASTKAGKR